MGRYNTLMLSLLSLVLLPLFTPTVAGYANPGSCSGACNVHDPSLIRRISDGTYFRFSTGNKISYASSSSIKGPWTVVGSVLPDGSSIDIAGYDDLWVRVDGDKKYFGSMNLSFIAFLGP
jgi:arabinan endo-1,5-alpha-L-arabinosidase